MKKITIKYLFSTLFCVLAIAFGAACGSTDSNDAAKLSISREYISIDVFETYDLDLLNGDGTETWKSENQSVATVDEKGIVKGIGEGTTFVIATVGKKEFKCEVTVFPSTELPLLVLNTETVELQLGDSFTISGSVSYAGQKYDNGEFSYQSYDESIASVSATGKITANNLGETQILVSANWEMYQNSVHLQKLVSVVVKEDVTLKIEEREISLGAFTISGYGKSYESTYALHYTAKKNGELLTENVAWSSSNESVATVDNQGVVTALAVGRAEITLNYLGDDAQYTSLPVSVVVEKPAFDLTYKKAVVLDYSLETITADAFKKVFDFNKKNDGGRSISQVIDLSTGVDLLADKTTLSLNKLAIEPGEYVYQICNPDYVVRVNVFVATKILKTAQDIVKLQEYGNIYAVDATGAITTEEIDDAANGKYIYSGYFTLGNDITFTADDYADGLTYLQVKSVHMGSKQPKDAGFFGVFDGMGYTISGVNVVGGGIFGDISSGGTVRNVSFKQMTCKAYGKTGHYASAIARNICGTLENVNVEIDLFDQYASAGLCFLFNGGTLKNVTVKASNPRMGDNKGALLIYWAFGECTIQNVFVELVGEYPIIYVDSGFTPLINKAESKDDEDDENWTPYL